MAKVVKEHLVFGLDIGTRSIVGTVGYKKEDRFVVVAQRSKEHETRAMIDGQIHDIKKVSSTILEVKKELEKEIGRPLKDVCIAAAGRVLRTITTHVETDFQEDKTITMDDIYALSAKGIEKAYAEFNEGNTTGLKFFCVGHSIIRYYINQYPISNPEEHKAGNMGADMIVTFLPEDVVDGLYKAVELAGLNAVNLTLEPIAAIQVAIPERFRMLNIALVDVGAGTSDISITKDGTIVAYGMIPTAGDSLTEMIAKHCLVDFNDAELIKRQIEQGGDISYTDIMGLPQTISAEELSEILKPSVIEMTKPVAECIKELNRDKAVSAVFVVGGGGKIPGYTKALAEQLEIVNERVAVRGQDVMGFVDFPDYVKKDSLLVTPVGICLSFYEHNQNLVYVSFNEQSLKVYDNGKLSVVDAAMQADFPNDSLFPKRGDELNFTVDKKQRIKRGMLGESAIIMVNGKPADIHTPIKANDVITVMPSTKGEPAKMQISALPEFNEKISVIVNGKQMYLPKFAIVNGEMKSGYYEIQSGDDIIMQTYYEAGQILELMDVAVSKNTRITVNNVAADTSTKVYENFTMTYEESDKVDSDESKVDFSVPDETEETQESSVIGMDDSEETSQEAEPEAEKEVPIHDLHVVVNHMPITLSGKNAYVYVDVFDYINFDLTKPKGSGIVTLLNGSPAEYLKEIVDGDIIEIYWKE